MEAYLEGVRCFVKPTTVPVRPLTLVVGENSSGKSTFLAVLDSVLRAGSFPQFLDLNTAPYNLGQYESIASKGGTKDEFSIGLCDSPESNGRSLIGTYANDEGQVRLRAVETADNHGRLTLKVGREAVTGKITLQEPMKDVRERDFSFSWPARFGFPPMRRLSMQIMDQLEIGDSAEFGSEAWMSFHRALQQMLDPFRAFGPRRKGVARIRPSGTGPLSLAPIRTKPRRTYDQAADTYDPEGEHIPIVLARTLGADDEKSSRLIAALKFFGKESGLFRYVKIRRLGRHSGDPFQVLVSVAGRARNVTDVGYGVSQGLPLVVESILADRGRTLLMQQPEVHLHPRAQAAFASLVVELVASDGKSFVIETHSDHVVDRIRRSVVRGDIKKENVLILFLERKGQQTVVYPLDVDEAGNLSGAPASYRRFFITEEMSLLLGPDGSCPDARDEK